MTLKHVNIVPSQLSQWDPVLVSLFLLEFSFSVCVCGPGDTEEQF